MQKVHLLDISFYVKLRTLTSMGRGKMYKHQEGRQHCPVKEKQSATISSDIRAGLHEEQNEI